MGSSVLARSYDAFLSVPPVCENSGITGTQYHVSIDDAMNEIRSLQSHLGQRFISIKQSKLFSKSELAATSLLHQYSQHTELTRIRFHWDELGWNFGQGIETCLVPYISVGSKTLGCEHGPDFHASQKRQEERTRQQRSILQKTYANIGLQQVRGRGLSPSKKMNCPAAIFMFKRIYFPGFRVPKDSPKAVQRKRALVLKSQLSRKVDVEMKIIYQVNYSKALNHNDHTFPEETENSEAASDNQMDNILSSSETTLQENQEVTRGCDDDRLLFSIDQEASKTMTEHHLSDITYTSVSLTPQQNPYPSSAEDVILPRRNVTIIPNDADLQKESEDLARIDHNLKNDCQDLLTYAWDATCSGVERQRLIMAKKKLKEVVAILNGTAFESKSTSCYPAVPPPSYPMVSEARKDPSNDTNAYLTSFNISSGSNPLLIPVRNLNTNEAPSKPRVHVTVDLDSVPSHLVSQK